MEGAFGKAAGTIGATIEQQIGKALDQVTRMSRMAGVQFGRAFEGVGGAFEKVNQSLSQSNILMSAMLVKATELADKMGSISAGGGGRRQGGAGASAAAQQFMSQAKVDAEYLQGLALARSRTTIGPDGKTQAETRQYRGGGTTATVKTDGGDKVSQVVMDSKQKQAFEAVDKRIAEYIDEKKGEILSSRVSQIGTGGEKMKEVVRLIDGSLATIIKDKANALISMTVRDAPKPKEVAPEVSPFFTSANRRQELTGSREHNLSMAGGVGFDRAQVRATQDAINRFTPGIGGKTEDDIDAMVRNMQAQAKAQTSHAAEIQKEEADRQAMSSRRAGILSQGGQLVGQKNSVGADGEKIVEEFYKMTDGTFVRYIEDWARMVSKVRPARGAQLPAGASTTAQDALAQINSTGGLFTNPFRQTSGKSATDAGGNEQQTNATYQRAAGVFRNAQTVSINFKTNTATSEIQALSSHWQQFVTKMVGDGGSISRSINLAFLPLSGVKSVVSGIGSAWSTVGNQLIRLSALYYSAERTVSALDAVLLGPIEKIVQATEQSRKFEASIAGIVGVGGARDINQAVLGNLNNTPFSLDQSRQTVTDMTKIAPLREKFEAGDTKQSMDLVKKFQDVLASLQVMNPQATLEEIEKGIEGAMLGQGRALRTMVRIDPDQLAQMVGKSSQKDFKGDPSLMLEALQKYTQAFAPAGAGDFQRNTTEVQIGHIKSQFEAALATIGDSGVFQNLVDKLKGIADGAMAYLSRPEYLEHAKSISDSMGHILDNVFEAATKLIEHLTGAQDVGGSAEGLANGIDVLFQKIAGMSDWLPLGAPQIGDALKSITESIGEFLGSLSEAAIRAKNFGHIPSGVEQAEDIAKRPEAIDSVLAAHGMQLRQKVADISLRDVFQGDGNSGADESLLTKSFSSSEQTNMKLGTDRLDNVFGSGAQGDVATAKYAPIPGEQFQQIRSLLDTINARTQGKLLGPDGQFADQSGVYKIIQQAIADDQKDRSRGMHGAATPGGVISGDGLLPPLVSPAPGSAQAANGRPQSSMASWRQALSGGIPDEVEKASHQLQSLSSLMSTEQFSANFKSPAGKEDAHSEKIDAALSALITNKGDTGLMKATPEGMLSMMKPTIDALLAATAQGDVELIAKLSGTMASQADVAKSILGDTSQNLNRAVGQHAFGLAQNTKNSDEQADLYRQAVSGQSPDAQKLATAEHIKPEDMQGSFGLMSQKDLDIIPLLDAATKSYLGQIKSMEGSGAKSGFDSITQSIDAVTQSTELATQAQSHFGDEVTTYMMQEVAAMAIGDKTGADKAAASAREAADAYKEAAGAIIRYSNEVIKLQAAQDKSGQEQIKTMGAYGLSAAATTNLLANTTSQSLINQVNSRGSLPQNASLASRLAGTPDISSQDVAFQQKMLADSQATFSSKQTNLQNNPGAAAQQAFDAAGVAVLKYASQLRQAQQASNEFFQSFIQFGNQVQKTLESSVGNIFDGLIERTKTLRQTLQSMAKSLVNDFSQNVSKTLFASVLGSGDGKSGAGHGLGGLIGQALGSGSSDASTQMMTVNAGSVVVNGAGGGAAGGATGLLGLLSGGAGGATGGIGMPAAGSDFATGMGGGAGADFGTGSGAAAGGLVGMLGSLFGGAAGAANGAVWSGGFTPFAGGGVVNKPTLGLVGERRDGMSEAIIPMPGGRVPLGSDASGIFAMLPGGKKVPAGMAFASGGIAAGGISFDRDYSGGMPSTGAGGSGGGGSSSGGQPVVIYNVANHEEAMQRGYSRMRGHIINDVLASAAPGGKMRRILSKPN